MTNFEKLMSIKNFNEYAIFLYLNKHHISSQRKIGAWLDEECDESYKKYVEGLNENNEA